MATNRVVSAHTLPPNQPKFNAKRINAIHPLIVYPLILAGPGTLFRFSDHQAHPMTIDKTTAALNCSKFRKFSVTLPPNKDEFNNHPVLYILKTISYV